MSTPLHGLLAEFAGEDAIRHAARTVRAAGLRQLDAYTPAPVEGLAEILGPSRNGVPLAALAGGVAAGLLGYGLQWYAAVVSYPINVGGRPLHSWPMFIPITFEMTILGATLAAVAAMLAGNRLPSLRHPVFEVPDFSLATRNRFFLCVRAGDDDALRRAREVLAGLDPIRVDEIPAIGDAP